MSETRSRDFRAWRISGLWASGNIAMRIWIDPDKAAANNISASDILSALRAQNAQVSAGALNQPPVFNDTGGAYQINVEALGRLTTPEQFGDIIVKSDAQGRVTRIRDIGRVELGSADYGSIAYADRHAVRSLLGHRHARRECRQGGARSVGQDGGAQEELPARSRLHQHLRPDHFRQPVHPRGDRDDRASRSFWWSASSTCSCKAGGRRSSLWSPSRYRWSALSRSSPLLGISINNLSLFGLVLAVGIVVDDAIVVVENVERNMAARHVAARRRAPDDGRGVHRAHRHRADAVRGFRPDRPSSPASRACSSSSSRPPSPPRR